MKPSFPIDDFCSLSPTGDLFRVSAPHCVAGLLIGHEDLTVIWSAPILRYMRGWPRKRVKRYCRQKGWEFEQVSTGGTA